MSRKLAIFKMGKYVHMVQFFWHHLLRVDVEKIGEFQDEKIRSHGSNFSVSPLGGYVEEIGNTQEGKYVQIVLFFGKK